LIIQVEKAATETSVAALDEKIFTAIGGAAFEKKTFPPFGGKVEIGKD